MTPMRANIVGPPSVATRIKASIAACHSAARVLRFRQLGNVVPASCSVTSWRRRGNEAVLGRHNEKGRRKYIQRPTGLKIDCL